MSALWVNDSGEVLCEKHAGGYLTHAIQARPKARLHSTPLGTWERLTAADTAAYDLNCETCRPFTTPKETP